MHFDMYEQGSRRDVLRRHWLAILSVCVGWLVLSLDSLWRHTSHLQAALILLAGVCGCAYVMVAMEVLNGKAKQLTLPWTAGTFIALLSAFLVLYPRSLKHTNGGSDREDAMRTALWAIHHHIYPYTLKTFLGNPITPLPGALLLAEPFYQLGHVALQNLPWMAAFSIFCDLYFSYRASSVLCVFVFLLMTPAALSDFTAGGDYVVNLIYVILASVLCVRSLRFSTFRQVSAAAFLGIVLSSRALYLPFTIPLCALLVQRASWRRVSMIFGVAASAFLIVTLPVFRPHPTAQLLAQLHQQSGKLRSLPAVLHAEYTLPIIAIGIAALAFRLRMNTAKMLLFLGIINTIMLAPPIVALVISAGHPVYEMDYLIVCVLPLALWVLKRDEALAKGSHTDGT